MNLRVIAFAALCLAALAWAGAPQRHFIGRGGFNPHADGADHGTETISLQIDVKEGAKTGWIVLAGDVHTDEGEGHEHPMGGPFPGTYMKMELLDVAKVEKKMITLEGIGHVNLIPAKIKITVEDGKGKDGQDHVHVDAIAHDGHTLLSTHGLMIVGDIKVNQGGKK